MLLSVQKLFHVGDDQIEQSPNIKLSHFKITAKAAILIGVVVPQN